MLVDKNKIKNKVLNKTCIICKNIISETDVNSLNFIYSKNKFGEKFCHETCLIRR